MDPDALAVCARQDGPPLWPERDADLPAFRHRAPPRHVHLLPSLSLGGAERIVVDLVRAFAECGTEADIVVLRDRDCEHPLDAMPDGLTLHRLGHLPWPERHAAAAAIVRASGLPGYCHLMFAAQLAPLWRLGCRTVPVVHNVSDGWQGEPAGLDVDAVPFVVACGEAVARALVAQGLRKPVRVLRHVVPARHAMPAPQRARVRAAFGVAEGQTLIGMTGRFVAQKNYGLAIEILAELRRRGRDARLAIVGAAVGPAAQACRADADAAARRLGVRGHVVMPGPVADAAGLAPAFDVFLNTSRFEGVSVATMEAVAAGVPVVASDVGGQSEAAGADDTLIDPGAAAGEWARAIEAVLSGSTPRQGRPADRRSRLAAAQAWPWTLALGPGAAPPARRRELLFVTGNLDVGGAQRSLCNLVAELAAGGHAMAVAIAGPIGVPGFMEAARAAGVEFLDLSDPASPGLPARAGRVMALAMRRCPRTLVFWNMDAAAKLLVAKAMAGGPVRLVDVSPGPMLYRELDAEAALGRALAFGPDQYLACLDVLVAKYRDGGPPSGRGQPRRIAVIANGVPAAGAPLPRGDGPSPPRGADPALAVVTVGRLAAAKRPDLLPLVARAIGRLLPGATLTVVGGGHEPGGAAAEGWRMMSEAAGGPLPDNLVLAGPDHRAAGFLGRFACFYMVSHDQGCPNASLEAMEAGLPVVANPDGGTAEQVEHGVTGLLVADHPDPVVHAERLADALASLLSDPARARRLGAAGRRRVRARFSMAAMAAGYRDVLSLASSS